MLARQLHASISLFLILITIAARGQAEGKPGESSPPVGDRVSLPVPVKKKLIEIGWDVPTPDFIQTHVREMAQRPFEGVVFHLRQCTHAFDTHAWKADQIQPDLDALAATEWGKMTENFPSLALANKHGMDWFNDAQWDVITANMKLFMCAVRAGRCPGICIDPEQYHLKLWGLNEVAGDRKPEAVFEQVRQRGIQFINALQSEQPQLKIFSLFNITAMAETMKISADRRKEAILKHPYCLWYQFYLGMLEGAGPGVTFIDGCEGAYYCVDSEQFYSAYHFVRQRALNLIPEALRSKYNAQSQAASTVFIDYVTGMLPKTPPHYLSRADQSRYLEHNLYYALDSSDEYVWCYDEKMDWWGSNRDRRFLDGREATGKPLIPAGVEETIVSARNKIEKSQRLGFDMKEALQAAHRKMKQGEAAP